MNAAQKFGLIGMLLNGVGQNKINDQDNPRLFDYLVNIGIGAPNRDNLLTQLHGNVSILRREFDYYDSSELEVNEPLDNYLIDLSNQINNADPVKPRDVAMMIVSLGNKPGDNDKSDGVKALLEMADTILSRYEDLQPGQDLEVSDECYRKEARELAIIERVMGLVDLFVTARFGMIAGVEEFAPLAYNAVHPLETFDIVGFECMQNGECKCGCAIDHSLKMLEGVEDYISGDLDSSNFHYLEGVQRARGQYLVEIDGTEGKVFEAIKQLGRVAYQASKEAWDNLVEFFDQTDEEADKEITNIADDNKKAIQSMKDKGAEINAKAKAGLVAMAEKVDPSGSMGKVVAPLTTPSSAGGVIDNLLGLLGTNSLVTKSLDDARKAAESALSDLKKATDAVSGDDANKEAAATAKAGLNEKIEAAREAVKEAKKESQDHSKITKGIRKAIKGITPHIFIAKDDEEEEDKK